MISKTNNENIRIKQNTDCPLKFDCPTDCPLNFELALNLPNSDGNEQI